MSDRPSTLSLALGLTLLAAAPAAAQEAGVTVGLKGGVTVSDLDVGDGSETETRSGLAGGAFLQIPLGRHLALQPEILFVQKGASQEDGASELELELDYVEVPLLVQARVPVSGSPVEPFLHAGPAVSFEASCGLEEEVGEEGPEEAEESLDCAELDGGLDTRGVDIGVLFGAGLGVEIGRAVLTVEGRYTLGLVDVNDTEGAGPGDELKNRALSLLAGIGLRL